MGCRDGGDGQVGPRYAPERDAEKIALAKKAICLVLEHEALPIPSGCLFDKVRELYPRQLLVVQIQVALLDLLQCGDAKLDARMQIVRR